MDRLSSAFNTIFGVSEPSSVFANSLTSEIERESKIYCSVLDKAVVALKKRNPSVEVNETPDGIFVKSNNKIVALLTVENKKVYIQCLRENKLSNFPKVEYNEFMVIA